MLNTINIKGKAYVPVNERLKYFRENFKDYGIEVKVLSLAEDTCAMQATITSPEGRVVSAGTARELKDDKGSFVNSTSFVENCETSAIGRALGNFGIGIDQSVASADEVHMAVSQQSSPTQS